MNRKARPIALGLLILLSLPARPALAQDIHQACRAGEVSAVEAILAANPELARSRDDRGRTPLHVAAAEGRTEVLRALLSFDPDIDAVDADGASALHLAVLGGHQDVVEALLAAGADIDLRNEQTDYSAIDLAFQMEIRGRSRLTRLLHSRGAVFDVNRLQGRMMNALDLAVDGRDADMVRFAIEQGADVNDTPYHAAPISWAALEGDTEIAELLVAAGADMNVPDPLGGVPLRWTVERGHVSTTRALLAAGADADFVEQRSGRNLLLTASLYGHLNLVELLLSHGLPVNQTDHDGRTPLDYATRYGHRAVAELLLENGAVHSSESVEENFGKSPHLTRAMREGEAVAWYLNHRGWVVRTRSHILVFDAEEYGVRRPTEPSLANGFLTPKEISDHPVVAFYTTYHGATGEPTYIHELEDSLSEIAYVHNGNDGFRGSEGTVYLKHGERVQIGNARITAAETPANRPNLGYLVQVDGLRIFYAGFRAPDRQRYRESLDLLAEEVDRVDMAFLPIIDPGEAESDFKDFLERFDPHAVVLLDPDLRVHLFGQVAALVREWGSEADVFTAENPGDHFVFRRR